MVRSAAGLGAMLERGVVVEVRDPQELVGAVLNQCWRLGTVIGEGGIGLVYQADSVRDSGGPYAVKILRSEFSENPAVVSRFLAEGRAAERVDHAGFVQVVEAACAEDGTPYLVMELLVGRPLRALMNEGPVRPDVAFELTSQILQALGAAHAAGVHHRDLKPDNVYLLEPPVNGLKVKILDLGLARVIDEAGGMKRKTQTGMLLGTPGYMAPEQVADVKSADRRADLWAAGILYYEMLTGGPAFVAENEFARLTMAMTQDPTPIESVKPAYAYLADFFRVAIHREPDQRFQTAAQMLEAMHAPSSLRASDFPTSGYAAPSQAAPASEATSLAAPASGGVQLAGRTSAPPPADAESNPTSGPFGKVDTAVSGGRGSSVPEAAVEVQVVRPAAPSVAIWLALVLCFACLVLGVLIGYALGSGA